MPVDLHLISPPALRQESHTHKKLRPEKVAPEMVQCDDLDVWTQRGLVYSSNSAPSWFCGLGVSSHLQKPSPNRLMWE